MWLSHLFRAEGLHERITDMIRNQNDTDDNNPLGQQQHQQADDDDGLMDSDDDGLMDSDDEMSSYDR